MPGNERLRSLMAARGIDPVMLAGKVGVDPKSVERWLSLGRVPHGRHRQAVVAMLDSEETYLWPTATTPGRVLQASQAEIVAAYPYRAEVPSDLWPALLRGACHQVDILVYAGLFLFEDNPHLMEVFQSRAASGCRIRVALGDSESAAVRARGEEEQFGDGIDSRARTALRHWQPLLNVQGTETRLHGTTLYNSIYRFDDQMLVNHHVWGVNAYLAPVLHLRRLPHGRLFEVFADSFETVWELATPLRN